MTRWRSLPGDAARQTGAARLAAMDQFLSDYDDGKPDGRYVIGELPVLPFEAGSFDLALCSHFLFLYSDNFSLEFHRKAIDEMCRVATEARIFPLLNYNSQPSPYVEPLLKDLADAGYEPTVVKVPYEFQRGGNQMLRVRPR